MKQIGISRRQFIFRSFLASSGIVLSTNFISTGSENILNKIKIPKRLENKNFEFGIASFDPTDSQVIIWTRYSSFISCPELVWQLSTDADFESILREGKVETDSFRDYTVSIEVKNLPSDSQFFYRFINIKDKSVSDIGETLTFPKNAEQVKIAACSCANFASGLFHVYREIANSDADVVVHLGDYIYEYGNGEYGTNKQTESLGRKFLPDYECIKLDDYRTRYKQYRSDENLKLAHQKKPFICVWDDHEIANDTYSKGAQNHEIEEGDFSVRMRDAIQAFSEYLPVRTADSHKIYRDFNIGNLVNLMMLDTRVIGRDKQLSYPDFFDSKGVFDEKAFSEKLNDKNRSLLGKTQREWLVDKVQSSSSKWQVLGQQVLMGKTYVPKEILYAITKLEIEIKKTGKVSTKAIELLKTQMMEMTKLKARHLFQDPNLSEKQTQRVENVLPYNLDAWDGYPVERENLYQAFGNKKVISLAGDTHNAWYNSLKDAKLKDKGEEFATASVSSPGLESYLSLDTRNIASFEQAMILLVDDLKYLNASQRGFTKVHFTKEKINTEWVFVDDILKENYLSVLDKKTSVEQFIA